MASFLKLPLTLLCISFLAVCDGDSYRLASICSHPVEQSDEKNCCAVGRSYPYQPDTFEPYSYSCETSVSACKSGIGGNLNDSRYPYVPDATYRKVDEFNSGCAVTNWVKENFTASMQALSVALKVKSVPENKQLECREVCDYDFDNGSVGGDPGLCPQFELRADIVGSLFSFYSTVDPSSYASEVTRIPIQNIATQFNVPDDEFQKCIRSEVLVHRSGTVQNIGQTCESKIGFDHQGSEIASTLKIGPVLSGTVLEVGKNIRWMEYTSSDSSFSINHSVEDYQKLFGGYVKRSGMLYHAAVAEIINENNTKICVQARPPLNVSKDDKYITKDAGAEVIERSARAVIKAFGEESKQNETTRAFYPGFQESVADISDNQKSTLIDEIRTTANPGVEVGPDYINSLAAWMDSALCNQMISTKDGFNHDYIRAFDAEFVVGKNPERRNNAKTRLLRCAFSDIFVSEDFKEGLRRAMQ